MVWPSDNSTVPRSSHYPTSAAHAPHLPGKENPVGFSTQGTQTSPTMAGQHGQNGSIPQGAEQQAAQPPRKPRRTAAKRYAAAARERRLQQEYNNYHHPPREEDIWICEFCEYESIFGAPPEALVRQYEIKDRRERKRLAEKRRLLEKAKMKGRKGKKNSKSSKNHANNLATQVHHSAAQTNYQQADPSTVQNHGTQSEEYYGDEYDDDSMAMPAPPIQAPAKIPQSAGHGYTQTARTACTNHAQKVA
jgi:hypothetical protein